MSQLAFEPVLLTAQRNDMAASESVRVVELQPADISRWDEFVSSCSEATFFHRAGWKTVIERAFGHRTFFLFAEAGGRIEGVLPLAEVKSLLFGHTLVSLPFCVYGGIAAHSERARRALDEAARSLAEKLRVDHLEQRCLTRDTLIGCKRCCRSNQETDRCRLGAQPACNSAQTARDGAQRDQSRAAERH